MGTMSAPRPAPLLAGDVGATKTNLALFTTAGGLLTAVAEANFVNGGYGGLEDVVRAFLARGRSAPTAACFGVAGPVAAGRARMPNLGWLIDAASLGRLLGLERVVSGPGLHNIYAALAVAEAPEVAARIAAAEDASATITELGLAGASARCTRALDVFVSAYGAEAGNLALRALATGGVHVGGGIAPKIVGKLADGTFMRAFTAKGRFADWLARIPVKVILDPKTALRGAAAYLASVEARS